MKPFTKKRYEKRFFLSLFIIVLILFAITSVCNFEKRKNAQTSTASEVTLSSKKGMPKLDQLSVASGIVYRHLVAYNLVCTESGQPLTKYPDYFSKKYLSEIKKIDEFWAYRGKSLASVLTDYDSRRYPKLAPEIQNELLEMERKIALVIKAQKAGTTTDKVEWTAQDENKLNLKDACLLFDDMAAEISEKTDFETTFRKIIQKI